MPAPVANPATPQAVTGAAVAPFQVWSRVASTERGANREA